MTERIAVGTKVSWVARGRVARLEGRSGLMCTGTVTGFSTVDDLVYVKPDYKSTICAGAAVPRRRLHPV